MYVDSLGGRYTHIHNSKRGQPHKAKPSNGGARKYGRNRPNAPGHIRHHWTVKARWRGGKLD